MLSLQGHRCRKTIGKEGRCFISVAKIGIPADEGKFYFGCAGAVPTSAAGKFLRKIFRPKTAVTAAARILRLIQSWQGGAAARLRRPAGRPYLVFQKIFLTLRAPLRVLAILKFENEKEI